MDELTHRLARLSSAEDYLTFFAIPFDRAFVAANRQRILKRFRHHLRGDGEIAGLAEGPLYARYRQLLAEAYAECNNAPAPRNAGSPGQPGSDGRTPAGLRLVPPWPTPA